MSIDGIDVSHHQNPALLNVRALTEANAERKRANGLGFFVIARACYGTRPDTTFSAFAERTRDAGAPFGAYLFYRQTESAEAQLEAFSRQLDTVGGLRPGELYPVLDIETNERYDGAFNATHASEQCQQIAESWLAEFGGVILYYSALQMPALLKRPAWMLGPGMCHWPADYGSKPGDPRVQPLWHIHQYGGDSTEVYGGGRVDANVLNPAADPYEMLVGGALAKPEPLDPATEAQRLREAAAEVRAHAESELARADELDRQADAVEVGA